jgi:7-keto-8-aminopelargonate synthetase-like enzyme
VGADFLAALVASCFLGALPPVDLRAVCLVLAMIKDKKEKREKKRRRMPEV